MSWKSHFHWDTILEQKPPILSLLWFLWFFAVKCPEWGWSPNLQTDQWSSASASSVEHVRWRNDSSRPVTAFTLGDNTLLIPVAVRGALREKGSPTVPFTSIPSALHGTWNQHRSCPRWSARLSHAWWAGSAPAGGWLLLAKPGCPCLLQAAQPFTCLWI